MAKRIMVYRTRESSGQKCPTCGTNYMRRLHRKGLLQKYLYSFFGFYPWECPICRVPVLLRKRHQRRSQAQSVTSTQQPETNPSL